MRPRPDVHAVEQPEVAVAHCLERPKQSQARGYADPRKHLLDEAGCPEFIVLRTHSSFFHFVGHTPFTLRASVSGFKPPTISRYFLPVGLTPVQGEADFDDHVGAQGKVSAEPFGKRASPGVASPPDAKPAPSGAARNTLDQNRLRPCRERSSGLYGSWNRRVKTEIPVDSAPHGCAIAASRDWATGTNIRGDSQCHKH